ncbi:hypothetical protein [Alkalihalobacillus deserti]|uniref:hypothetical protein n=1 Tax=Alkalihalobacillus deserti TaxID=2879466 RepID=UPI001D15D1C4|nr:hypothetical protein [Alkalihalobacillus deserti]
MVYVTCRLFYEIAINKSIKKCRETHTTTNTKTKIRTKVGVTMKELKIKVSQEVEDKLKAIAQKKDLTIEDAATLVLTQYTARYINLIQRFRKRQIGNIKHD